MRLISTTPVLTQPVIPPLQKTYTIEVTAEELLRIMLLSLAEGGRIFPEGKGSAGHRGNPRIHESLEKIEPNALKHLYRLGLTSGGYSHVEIWTHEPTLQYESWVTRVHQP